jgi:hypothetical protein
VDMPHRIEHKCDCPEPSQSPRANGSTQSAGTDREPTDYPHGMQGNNPRQSRRRSLIAFLGGLGLLTAGLISTKVAPVLSTVTAIVGIAAMIYGLAAAVMVVVNRDDDGSPD